MPALRHYDQLGLLKPAQIDPNTAYRYYTADQLPRLHRILALKDLGFSLAQIVDVLGADLPAAEIRGMLKLKRAEMERLVEEEQGRLARIETRLLAIEQDGGAPAYDVVLKHVDPFPIVSVRMVIPTVDDLALPWGQLHAYLNTRGIASSLPNLIVWHASGYRAQGIDTETAVPLAIPLTGNGEVAMRMLPSVETMACVAHRGDHLSIAQAYAALYMWVEANGYCPSGPERQVLHRVGAHRLGLLTRQTG